MKTCYVLTLCTALVLGGTLIPGSSEAFDKAEVKTPTKDTWLAAKTKIALAADARVKGSQINVKTAKGSVMLSGKVNSSDAKRAAEDIVNKLDGVKSVENDLAVFPLNMGETVENNDEAITARVKEQIRKDAQLKKAGIAVRTTAGVVSLTGEVRDLVSSALASWTAWHVPGVESVKNDLTVKEEA
jgi:hyperosmotically inducible periplasmic protein